MLEQVAALVGEGVGRGERRVGDAREEPAPGGGGVDGRGRPVGEHRERAAARGRGGDEGACERPGGERDGVRAACAGASGAVSISTRASTECASAAPSLSKKASRPACGRVPSRVCAGLEGTNEATRSRMRCAALTQRPAARSASRRRRGHHELDQSVEVALDHDLERIDQRERPVPVERAGEHDHRAVVTVMEGGAHGAPLPASTARARAGIVRDAVSCLHGALSLPSVACPAYGAPGERGGRAPSVARIPFPPRAPCAAWAWRGGRSFAPRGRRALGGVDPEIETAKLTRMLAASWMLGHCDLHRRNGGFTHAGTEVKCRIEIAPMYDVSSAIGTRMEPRLALGIARRQALAGLGPRRWLVHARQCGVDPEQTVRSVRDVVNAAHEAIATARDRVRQRDENR